MVRNISLALVLVFAGVLSAFSQATWNGLQFDSSPADVQKVLAEKNLNLKQVGKDTWSVTPAWTLRALEPLKVNSFKVRLSFAGGNELQRITLRLNEHQPATYTNAVDRVNQRIKAAFRTYQLLIAKYGRPITTDAACTSPDVSYFVGKPKVNCDAMWKARGQSVTFGWTYMFNDLGLLIKYTVAQTGGL